MSDRRILAPKLDWFSDWMQQTGEEAPDFDLLPSIPHLPDLLTFADGRPVETTDHWDERRTELLQQVQHWLTGAWPDAVPELLETETLAEEQMNRVLWRHVKLTFGDGTRTFSFDIEVMIPEGASPCPVFLTQSNHRRWAAIGVSRDCLCCVYPGADLNDQSEQLKVLYPECDWSKLTRRAWLGARALDYVLSLPEADSERVCITGHSRNGKQSLIAAAMDERFTAVISSSSGTGGAIPWRCSSEFCFQESVEFMTRNTTTRDWFHPRLRFFTGREDRLPVDTHALLALSAPRACLLSDAFNDGCGSTFGVEQAYLAARTVYELLGEGRRFGIAYRWGNHETDSQVIHRYFDWFDAVQAEGYTQNPFPLIPRCKTPTTCSDRAVSVTDSGYVHPADVLGAEVAAQFYSPRRHSFCWHEWSGQQTTADIHIPDDVRQDSKAALKWLLNCENSVVGDAGGKYGSQAPHRLRLLGQNDPPEGVQRLSLNFGEYVSGEIFFPKDPPEALTPVIWLHPFSHSYGYTGAYMVGAQTYLRLAQEGYLVFAFNQIGLGPRVQEGLEFTRRYPRGSLLGKMVTDVQAAVDVLTRGNHSWENATGAESLPLPTVRTDRITCLGYSLGGLVALVTAALDERIDAVASFSGAVPWNHMPIDVTAGPMQPFWQRLQLLPKLGLFAGQEQAIPVSLRDILKSVAPRNCLIVAPECDREIRASDVVAEIAEAQSTWCEPGALTFLTPDDYNRFQTEQQNQFLDWMTQIGYAPR